MSWLRPADAAALAALAVVGVGLALVLARSAEVPVERSAIGHRGLVAWLQADGRDARYAGMGQVERGTIGLRILPVLDTDPDAPFAPPADRAEWLATGTERDVSSSLLRRKAELLPTLLIAPKWTRAMRHSGHAHESLRLPAGQPETALKTFGLHDGAMLRRTGLLAVPGPDGARGLLYAAQLFPPQLGRGCQPVLSAGGGHLLIRCARPGGPVWALSDPDLLNNHGLRLAGNAALATAVIDRIAGPAPVLVDTTDRIFTVNRPPPLPRRDWADLARLVAWPISIAWGGLAALAVLLVWRGAVRFGPPRPVFDDSPPASRAASIAATARVLRMAGNDAALVRAHAANRLRRLEARILGRSGAADPVQAIAAALARRDADLAAGFRRAAQAAMTAGPGASAAQLTSLVEEFELAAERALHAA